MFPPSHSPMLLDLHSAPRGVSIIDPNRSRFLCYFMEIESGEVFVKLATISGAAYRSYVFHCLHFIILRSCMSPYTPLYYQRRIIQCQNWSTPWVVEMPPPHLLRLPHHSHGVYWMMFALPRQVTPTHSANPRISLHGSYPPILILQPLIVFSTEEAYKVTILSI